MRITKWTKEALESVGLSNSKLRDAWRDGVMPAAK